MDSEPQISFLASVFLNLRKQPRIMKNLGKVSELKDRDQKKLKRKNDLKESNFARRLKNKTKHPVINYLRKRRLLYK